MVRLATSSPDRHKSTFRVLRVLVIVIVIVTGFDRQLAARLGRDVEYHSAVNTQMNLVWSRLETLVLPHPNF